MKRTGRLKTYAPLERHTPLRQVSLKRLALQSPAGGGTSLAPARGLTRSPMKASRPKAAVPPARRKSLTDRSDRLCEAWLTGCWGRATDPHHRITRGTGGRHGQAKERSDRMSGLLHVCRPCHRWIHEHPAAAEPMGLLLAESAIPAQVPVLYRGEPMYLDDDGRMWALEEVGA